MSKNINPYNLKHGIESISWILPSIILFGIFLIYPIGFSVVLSFFKWNGYSKDIFSNFVGFSNYIYLFKDPIFWVSFKNTLIVVFVLVVFMTGIALFSALIIFFGNFKLNNLTRAIIFFPGIISQIIIGLVFRRILALDGGLNQLLSLIGLKKFAIAWLNAPNLVIWIVAFVLVWQWIGYIMIIFYAALQNIDHELLDAAFIDGASLQGAIFKIVVPQIRYAIFLSAVLNFIGGFRSFNLIWIMTNGGPAHASEVFTTYMYNVAFGQYGPSNMGYGSAIAVILAIIVVIFAVIRIKFFKEIEGV
ncbi:MAG: sugar ABC transporter permease [Actinobacteria bacterium]|nr:sugar ABC transporter permease [Actinomycetota bacterium]